MDEEKHLGKLKLPIFRLFLKSKELCIWLLVINHTLHYSLQFVMSGWGTGYSFHCDLVNYSDSPQAVRVSRSFTN